MNKSKSKGFTLIELLVVITILAVLSTIGFVIYSGVLPRARDSRRISDLNKLATALQLYYERHGRFIDGTPGSDGNCSGLGGSGDTAAFYTDILPYLTDSSVPKDPKKDPLTNNYPYYCYVSFNNGQSYRLFTNLEQCEESGGNLCSPSSLSYNFSVFSNDLTLQPPP